MACVRGKISFNEAIRGTVSSVEEDLRGEILCTTDRLHGSARCVVTHTAPVMRCVSEHVVGRLHVICTVKKAQPMYLYSSDGYALMDNGGTILMSKK